MSAGVLQEKVALVTGVSNGIGRAVARLFAREGAVVYGADRDEAGAAALAGEIAAEGGSFHFTPLNLLSGSAIDSWVASVAADEGRIDVLCNVAGVSEVLTIEETDEEALMRTLGVNLLAPYRLCQQVVPHMKAAGRGAIVNVASELAFVAQPGFSAYCASKGGVLAFTRALALELAEHGVRANVLCPGPIDTPMLQAEFRTEADPAAAERAAVATIPMGRLGQAEEIARAALFLASDQASFMLGASILVDGGKTLM